MKDFLEKIRKFLVKNWLELFVIIFMFISILGTLKLIEVNNELQKIYSTEKISTTGKIVAIESIGTTECPTWKSSKGARVFCVNLVVNFTDQNNTERTPKYFIDQDEFKVGDDILILYNKNDSSESWAKEEILLKESSFNTYPLLIIGSLTIPPIAYFHHRRELGKK